MPSLKLQKRLAASIKRCGKNRIWLDPNEVLFKFQLLIIWQTIRFCIFWSTFCWSCLIFSIANFKFRPFVKKKNSPPRSPWRTPVRWSASTSRKALSSASRSRSTLASAATPRPPRDARVWQKNISKFQFTIDGRRKFLQNFAFFQFIKSQGWEFTTSNLSCPAPAVWQGRNVRWTNLADFSERHFFLLFFFKTTQNDHILIVSTKFSSKFVQIFNFPKLRKTKKLGWWR